MTSAGVVQASMQARYQNSNRGQFISEDPVFLAIGSPSQLKQLSQKEQLQFLTDPQALNAYGYARDNPISKSDPLGLESKLFSSSPLLATLELFGYVSLLNDAKAYVNSSGQSATTQNSTKAQLQVDSFVTAVGFAGNATEAAGLTVAGTALQGVDAYCSNHICQDFSGAAKSTPGAVLASMRPAPGTVPSPYGLNSNGPILPYQVQRNSSSVGGAALNSNAGTQLISSLQSLVSALSAYVASLSQSSSNSGTIKR